MTKAVAIVLCLLLMSPWVQAAIAVDSQESGGTAHKLGTSPLTWTFTNTAGTKLVCGFVTTTNSAGTVPTMSVPTYNSVAMTLAGTQQSSDSGHTLAAVYYLDSPATGAKTVSLTWTGTGTTVDAFGGCMSFTGTASGVGTVTQAAAVTTDTTATAPNITTASGNYIFATGSWGSGLGGTAGSGFTRTFLLNGGSGTGGDDILGEYEASAGSAITPTFTWTNADLWSIVAVALTASGGASTGVCPSMNMLGVGGRL